MDHTQDTIKHVKGKHFSYGDRRELQGMLSNKSVHYSLRQLARHFNCAPNTIRNELNVVLIIIPVDMELDVHKMHMNKAMLTASRNPKDFCPVSLFPGWLKWSLKKVGPWTPATVMPRHTGCLQTLR